jgi:predicted nuclease with TOPRIM domain
MINLEQVKLLEVKVAKTIDYVERLSRENAALLRQETEFQVRLESYQKRIDELEVLIMGFKEEQSQIEDGILSALDRLNQFEEAIEKSLKEKPAGFVSVAPAKSLQATAHHVSQKAATQQGIAKTIVVQEDPVEQSDTETVDEKICFEIPETESGDDILDPLAGTLDDGPADTGHSPVKGGELDIF